MRGSITFCNCKLFFFSPAVQIIYCFCSLSLFSYKSLCCTESIQKKVWAFFSFSFEIRLRVRALSLPFFTHFSFLSVHILGSWCHHPFRPWTPLSDSTPLTVWSLQGETSQRCSTDGWCLFWRDFLCEIFNQSQVKVLTILIYYQFFRILELKKKFYFGRFLFFKIARK